MAARTVDELCTIAEAELLRAGGVDSWEWYDESMQLYTPSKDLYEDAESFVSALGSSGVDSWDFRSESLAGLAEYREHLEELPELSKAEDFYSWTSRVQTEDPPSEVDNSAVEGETKAPAATPSGATEERLYAYLAENYPQQHTDELFAAAKDAGIWKAAVFEAEFKLAMREFDKGAENPLEATRAKLFELIVKRKKLDPFVQGLLAV